ncbi:MAG: peptidoglycan-binding protein [Alphaproteobacteria bacterium]
MKSNIPWSVKGIDPEAREAAKIAARRAGMTLGEWLNSLILQSGEIPEGLAAQLAAEAHREEAAGGRHEYGDDDDEADDPGELQNRLETLSRRMESSERNSALAVSGIDHSIERLASTIESSRRLLASGEVAAKSSVNELSDRMDRLQSQLDQIAAHPRSGAGIDGRTLMALEKAIAGVAGHIEKSDRRNADLVQTVETAIADLTAKVTHAETTSSEAISRVDIAIDRLGSRIDATESEQRRSSARLNERLAQLDERVATALVQRESGIGAVERRLAGLETRIESVQGQIKAQIDEVRSRPLMSPDAFSRKEFEDWTRRQAADQGTSQATLRQSLANIEARVAVLNERADRLQREGGGQAAETARAAGDRADAAAKRLSEVSEGLRAEVASIAERMDKANHTATETMQALESVLRSLTRRLETLENRPAGKATGSESAATPTAPAAEVEDETAIEIAEIEEVVPAPRGAPTPDQKPSAPGWVWRDTQKEPPRAAETRPSSRWDEDTSTEEVVEVYEPEPAPAEAPAEREFRFGTEAEREEIEEEGGVDLSKLVFNLDGARDRKPEADTEDRSDPFRAEPLRGEPARSEFSPFDGPEDRAEARSEDNSWLEQARRAAKASSAADRTEYGEERKSGGGRMRVAVIAAIVILVLAAAGFLGSRLLSRKPSAEAPTTTAPATPGTPAAGKPTTQKPPSATDNAAPTPPAANPDDVLAPRESDVGAPIPDASKSDATASPPTEVASAPPQAPLTASKQTPDEALKAGADSGNPRAQFAYAMSLKDKVAAADYLKKAASQGLVIAQGRLGEWYEHGTGLQASETEAAKWYARAAEGGHVQSMHNFGYFNAAGMGGLKKDGTAAERWFRRAAERGLVASQVNLAIVLFDTVNFPLAAGADPDARLKDAYFWAALAAAHGDAASEQLRDTIAKTGDFVPEVRANLDSRAEKWKAQPIDVVANGGFDMTGQSFLPPEQQTPLASGDLVQVQQMLKELGYFKGGADGKASPQLEQAIKSYQTAAKLQPTGTADQGLVQALKVSTGSAEN